MNPVVIASVDLLVLRHPLLDAEDVVTELERGLHLALAPEPTDLVAEQRHERTYRRMSCSRAAALRYGPALSNTFCPSRLKKKVCGYAW